MPPMNRKVVTNKKIDKKSLLRLVRYVYDSHKFSLLIVLICIILSAVSNVIVNSYMASLIDTVILPGMSEGLEKVKDGLIRIMSIMIVLDLLGVVGSAIYPQIMSYVGQKTIKTLRDEMGDSTLILIEQRISAVRDADKILVMENGAIVGIGTHESLMADNAVYQEIYYSQMEKEGEE